MAKIKRTEVLNDGSISKLPSHSKSSGFYFCECLVSGGQTGVERGVLEFALQYLYYTHKGSVIQGRYAEDGQIAKKYQLSELASDSEDHYADCNVKNSDATMIINLGKLESSVQQALEFAQKSGKPYLMVPLDEGITKELVEKILAWLQEHEIKELNVTGPFESQRAGIAALTLQLLIAMDEEARRRRRPSSESSF